MVPLRLFNSLTRSIETFEPVHPGEARVYTCGPTVYNYQHVGNMRAYVFADTLGRVLSFKDYKLRHVINITDVGHLTSDADEGADKMETAAVRAGKSAWDIAKFYTDAYWRDIARLNIRQPATWSIATEYVPQMIEFAKSIEASCYQLPSGLYFDTTTVPEYGRLARTKTDEGESRIEAVEGKRHPTDFAIWRTTPPGETRQMEWDSPWGRGAPGWHLECSVMSEALLGFPFDIHTGGIDHREIHHPNEIAQNQARCHSADSGARIWMHNNFLIDRGGKMSKSKGEFLTLQALVDRGFHPLAYRLMCLQAHYRSELEFTFENLAAALTRLKRMVMAAEKLSAADPAEVMDKRIAAELSAFDEAVSDDLNTAKALTHFETVLTTKGLETGQRRAALARMDAVLGLTVLELSRAGLRVRPEEATIDKATVEARLAQRKEARAAKDFATSDRIRDELAAAGIEVMDGDPLGWDWKLDI
ncbi:cysteine--tRNA ligase [Sphingomonas sp. MAH-20]|uniref:Cysteine--tRNA ligase n=1 Tax=Sphingomonas horti TaxID=2682842 RepID=A0A6I4J0V9_9SPHN|nr:MULTISPECIES: cysteine--tRNA ligase [Sphingomonas]MBA2919835.1 cysteine--tRNA ligase [Sphingomonas sp. CGMCC 1.13658]MVO78075.1 cysteine--tRNA ligase [Sphingomonas horti]